MNPKIPPINLKKNHLSFHPDTQVNPPHTPPCPKNSTRDKISRFSPRGHRPFNRTLKKHKSDEKKTSRKNSSPLLPQAKKSPVNHKNPLHSPRVHISKSGKLFSSDKVKSARDLLSLNSSDTFKVSDSIPKTKNKSCEDLSIRNNEEKRLMMKTSGDKTTLCFLDSQEVEEILSAEDAVDVQDFCDAYIHSMSRIGDRELFFTYLSQAICSETIKDEVAEAIVKIFCNRKVKQASGLKDIEFLHLFNRYSLIDQHSAEVETMYRGDSILTSVMTTYLRPRLDPMLERALKKARQRLRRLPSTALKPSDPKFTSSDADKIEKILNRLLKDTLSEVKKMDIKIQCIFRKLYNESRRIYHEDSAGRILIVGTFFLRLLNPKLISVKCLKSDREIRWQKAYTIAAKLLQKTLLETMDEKTLKALEDSLEHLFKGKGYQMRRDLVEQIIQHLVGIYPGDWTFTSPDCDPNPQ